MITNISTATPLPFFNMAQTFLVDGSLAPNNTLIAITAINVYFEYMPASNSNSSTIQNPGITLYLANTVFNVPQITTDTLQNYARCEYAQIMTSSDASLPSQFIFNTPVLVQPGQLYALVLSFDGNEMFIPWSAVNGEWVVGSRNVYGGSSGVVGQLFEYASPSGDTVNSPINAQTEADYLSFWNPLNNSQMTFDVFAARYFVDGVPVDFAGLPPTTPIYSNNVIETWNNTTNTVIFSFPSNNPEAITFNPATSDVQSFIGAQQVYQNTFPYPGGVDNVTISTTTGNTLITANSTLPNGVAFNWNNIYPSLLGNPGIVLIDVSGTNVRYITQIASNTVIQVNEPVTFTNAIATFFVSPLATVDSTLTDSPYGKTECLLFLQGSNANSSTRFVNNTILSVDVGTGTGTGYNNTDVLYITGYQNVAAAAQGGYVAVANIQTNATGGIVNVYMSNAGCGFVNSTNIVPVIANSSYANGNINPNISANSSNGSTAVFTYTIGATLCTEMNTNIFQNCVVSDFNIDDITPYVALYNPIGTTYEISLSASYYFTNNNSTFSGYATYVSPTPQIFSSLNISQINSLLSKSNNSIAFVSHSNEFNLCYANGVLNTVNAIAGYSNSIVLNVATTTNVEDDYLAVSVQSVPSIEFGHYNINNSYYNEYTNSGNAWSKHITTLIPFSAIAEDARIFLTVYQPVNTSFQCFCRIQNPNDMQPFSQENWTLMQLINGKGLYSSLTDPTDYIQLSFGFPQWPGQDVVGNNLGLALPANTLPNTVTTSNNSATVTGTGFVNYANLQGNSSVVRIYSPLFPNNDYMVASVVAVGSDTSITLDANVSSNVNIGGNPALVGSGLAMDVLGYPDQAWNNINNDNVVRYYNSSNMKYDGYGTLEIKVVFQSSQMGYIPQLSSVVLYGLTA